MADLRQEDIAKQLQAFALQQLTQPRPQAAPLNLGLLAPGQEGFRDVLRSPDQAQVNALIGGLAGAVNPRGGSPVGTALANAAQQFAGTRQGEFQGRLAQRKQEQAELQNRIQNTIGIAGLSRGISQDEEQRRQFGVTEGRIGSQFERTQGLAETRRESVDILSPDGQFVGTATQGPQGRLFQFDEQGQPVDVSAQIQEGGFRVAPSGRPQLTSNIFNVPQETQDAVTKGFLERRAELVEGLPDTRNSLINADQMIRLSETATTGTGAEVLTGIVDAGVTGLRFLGLEKEATRLATKVSDSQQLDLFNINELAPILIKNARGLTEKEGEKIRKKFAGITTSRERNITAGHLMKANVLEKRDETFFFDAVAGDITGGGRKSSAGVEAAFDAYSRDLPRFNSDTLRSSADEQQLWKYYANGRPKSWTIRGQGDFTLKQMKAVAAQEGLSIRELIAEMDADGDILGVK